MKILINIKNEKVLNVLKAVEDLKIIGEVEGVYLSIKPIKNVRRRSSRNTGKANKSK